MPESTEEGAIPFPADELTNARRSRCHHDADQASASVNQTKKKRASPPFNSTLPLMLKQVGLTSSTDRL